MLLIASIASLIAVTLFDDPMMPALKVSLLRVATVIIASLWFWKCYSSSQPRIKWTPIDLLVIAFLAIAAISTVVSVHLPTALHGRYSRFEGIVTLLNYALIYFLAMQIFYSASRMKSFAGALTVTGGLLGLHGALQYLGVDPLSAHFFGFWEKGRAYSVFGNPNIYAGFMALALPLALMSVLAASSRRGRIIYTAALMLIGIGLLVSFTRGSWAAVLLALLLFPFLTGRAIKSSLKTFAFLIACLLAVTASVVLLTIRSDNPVTNIPKRIASVIDDRNGSVAERFEIWRTAVAAIAARPLLGAGLDSFHLVFYRYEPARLAKLGHGVHAADNAHNYFLNLAVGVGIPGTIVQALVLALLFGYGIAALHEKKDIERLVDAGFISSAISYLGHLQTTVSSVETTAIFWALLGAIAGLTKISRLKNFSGHAAGRGYAISGIAPAAAVFLLFVTAQVTLGDIHHSRARQARITGTAEMVVTEYNSAISLYPHEDVFVGAGEFAVGANKLSPNPALVSWGVDTLREGTSFEPLEPRLWALLGELLLEKAKGGDLSSVPEAQAALIKALKIRPYSSQALFDLGDLYLMQGKTKEAAGAFERSLEFNPEDPTALFLLGKCYEDLGVKDKAISVYRRALRLSPNDVDAKAALEKLEKE